MECVYLYAKRSPEAIEFAKEVAELIKAEGLQPVSDQEELNFLPKITPREIKKCRLCVVVGGDGTFIAAARKVAPLGVPITGINLGTFGFLTEIETIEVKKLLPKILKGEYQPQERLIFEVYTVRNGKETFIEYAINDAVISKAALSRMIDIAIDTSLGHLGTISGDGIIVATPTGSTAYALAAGGPIVYPTLEAKILVPICPHTLTQRPIVLGGEVDLSLSVSTDYSTVYLTVDGQIGKTLKPGEKVLIKTAPFKLRVYTHPYRSYFDLLRIKLKWGKR